MASLGREHQRLSLVVQQAARLEKMDEELAQARELLSFDDPEMAAVARSEVATLEAAISEAEAALKPLLLPPDPLHDRNAIVEIRVLDTSIITVTSPEDQLVEPLQEVFGGTLTGAP